MVYNFITKERDCDYISFPSDCYLLPALKQKLGSHTFSDGFSCYGPDLDQRLGRWFSFFLPFLCVAEFNNIELENIEESVLLTIHLGYHILNLVHSVLWPISCITVPIYAFSPDCANSVWYCLLVYDLKLVNTTQEFPKCFALFVPGPFFYEDASKKSSQKLSLCSCSSRYAICASMFALIRHDLISFTTGSGGYEFSLLSFVCSECC